MCAECPLVTETRKGNDYTFVLIGLFVNSFVPIVTRQTKACSWIEVEHVVNDVSQFLAKQMCTHARARARARAGRLRSIFGRLAVGLAKNRGSQRFRDVVNGVSENKAPRN